MRGACAGRPLAAPHFAHTADMAVAIPGGWNGPACRVCPQAISQEQALQSIHDEHQSALTALEQEKSQLRIEVEQRSRDLVCEIPFFFFCLAC